MAICLLSIFSLLLCQFTNVRGGHAAFCFLTRQLLPETLEFAQELARDALQHGVEIFIMIDDNNFDVSNINTSLNLQLLQIPNELCIQHNYQNAISLSKPSLTSWDKALFYFNILKNNYSFIWLSEDDVFIPTVQAFISLHELYSNTSDLIASGFRLNLSGDPLKWNWGSAVGRLIPPWAGSMVNIVGLSRRLLRAADDYIQWLGQIPFHEHFFHTLAMKLNFTIVTPIELSTDVYRMSYFFHQIKRQPNNIWHPYKDTETQKLWRESLAKKNLIKNTDVTFTDIEMLCHENRTMTSIEEHLQDLLFKFDICKSKFSADNRRLLRQRFSYLAEQCQKRNASNEIVYLTKKLADHAYKLPEPVVKLLVPKKSEYHLKLEKAVEENKKSIYGLSWNSSSLVKLRVETSELIMRLTGVIQREYKERKKLGKS